MRKILCLTAVAMLGSTGAIAAPASHALKGASMMPMARVSLAAARASAVKARPGVITDQELEKEGGRQRSALFVRPSESRQNL